MQGGSEVQRSRDSTAPCGKPQDGRHVSRVVNRMNAMSRPASARSSVSKMRTIARWALLQASIGTAASRNAERLREEWEEANFLELWCWRELEPGTARAAFHLGAPTPTWGESAPNCFRREEPGGSAALEVGFGLTPDQLLRLRARRRAVRSALY
jgi:hypothetical protein